eukprot:768525-Hanusia_phi.AAC.1
MQRELLVVAPVHAHILHPHRVGVLDQLQVGHAEHGGRGLGDEDEAVLGRPDLEVAENDLLPQALQHRDDVLQHHAVVRAYPGQHRVCVGDGRHPSQTFSFAKKRNSRARSRRGVNRRGGPGAGITADKGPWVR